jgi:hypothetical protein
MKLWELLLILRMSLESNYYILHRDSQSFISLYSEEFHREKKLLRRDPRRLFC